MFFSDLSPRSSNANRCLAAHLSKGIVRQVDAARLTFALDARSQVDDVAKNVVAVDDDVTNVDSDTELNTRRFGGLVRHFLLDRDRASDRIDGARELD